MRFIHTADWHLGLIMNGRHLTEDQSFVLDQIVEIARDSRADAVVIAGDVYDRAVPPPEAVALLDDVLSRLVLGLGTPVILIAGNHDSPQRIEFGARVLRERGLHVAGTPRNDRAPVIVGRSGDAVCFHAAPYLEASRVVSSGNQDSLDLYGTALSRIAHAAPSGVISVLVAHAFVQGGRASESERPLFMGGLEGLHPNVFSHFHYTALGHLHRPQTVSSERIAYSGAILKYSLSEVDHVKSVSLVEPGPQGFVKSERIPLVPRHDLRIIKAEFAEVIKGPQEGESPDDYVVVVLSDTDPVLDAMDRIREVYPNCLSAQRACLLETPSLTDDACATAERPRLDHETLFARFFKDVAGEELSAPHAEAYKRIVADLTRAEREADNR